jgi:hypothetical protein
MAAQIEIGELLKCQNPKCQTEFRWVPHNSTIKPKFCPRCTALKKFEQDRITYNKKMLERSNLASYRSKFQQKRDKYPIKGKNGREVKKTTPKDKFYKSSAWRWFSRYILLTNTIDKGSITVRCCTCGKLMRIDSRECHVGHYIKVFDGNSTNYAIAFVEANTGPQCLRCNKFMGGRQDEMAVWIKNKYGQDTLDKLYELKRLPLKLTDAYLQEIADEYKKKFYSYLKENNLQNPWKK